MRNISAPQITNAAQTNGASARPSPDRQTLERELLDEMTAWPAGDRGDAFRTWHRHALSLVHLNVLTALEALGALSMKQLAEAMDVSDASATGIVDRMEKRGLVERRHDVADRRVVLVHPTEAGAQVFPNMAAQRREFLTRVLAELSEDEMNALLKGMRAMRAARRKLVAAALAECHETPSPAAPPAAPPAADTSPEPTAGD
jgi:DNA-binding MarR family transcriptional regulator